MNKFCILFSGAVGSSKTPIANYLSYKLNLPVFNHDAIRTEVLEDLSVFNEDEFIYRRDKRGQEILLSGISFIYDASIDREWKRLKPRLQEAGYQYYIISLDLSLNFLTKLYTIKHYDESLARIDDLIFDHQNFLKEYNEEINLRIDDSTFYDRLKISYDAVSQILKHK